MRCVIKVNCLFHFILFTNTCEKKTKNNSNNKKSSLELDEYDHSDEENWKTQIILVSEEEFTEPQWEK